MSKFLCFLFGLSSFAVWLSDSPGQPAQLTPKSLTEWPKRQEQLLAKLERARDYQPLIALEELSALGQLKPHTSNALMRLWTDPKSWSSSSLRIDGGERLFDAMSASGPEVVPIIAARLRNACLYESDSLDFREYVTVLGRMGNRAKTAVQTVRDCLDKTRNSEAKAFLRVALADLGDRSQENMERIQNDLLDEQSVAGAIAAIYATRATEWITHDMIQAIIKYASTVEQRDGLEGAINVAATLGSLGERAQTSARLIGDLRDKVQPLEGRACIGQS
jgi:hypothetical protein